MNSKRVACGLACLLNIAIPSCFLIRFETHGLCLSKKTKLDEQAGMQQEQAKKCQVGWPESLRSPKKLDQEAEMQQERAV